MNKKNIYSIPDLSTKEIISYLSELNISISATDILKPTTIVCQAIYDAILELFDNQEIGDGDESFLVIKQVQRMGNFLNKIGVNNFTIRDISPDSRRFIQILSTICNFGMYRDNKRQVYEQASKMIEDNFIVKKGLENQQRNLKAEIEATNKEIDENIKTKAVLEEDIIKLEAEFKDFYNIRRKNRPKPAC